MLNLLTYSLTTFAKSVQKVDEYYDAASCCERVGWKLFTAVDGHILHRLGIAYHRSGRVCRRLMGLR